MTRIKRFHFFDNPEDIKENESTDTLKAELSLGIYGENNLFSNIASKLKFPNYFGNNWNALNDCLNDLSWIKEKNIMLIHSDLPTLTKEELRIYLEILADTVAGWENDAKHTFCVFFPIKYKEQIIGAL